MYHSSNFGSYAGEVQQYADIDGYVPEAGDHWSQMRWDAATEWNADTWQEHVEAAVRATERAEQGVTAWRGRAF